MPPAPQDAVVGRRRHRSGEASDEPPTLDGRLLAGVAALHEHGVVGRVPAAAYEAS
tara:strand:- start:617 stop:784 length:168 start_codon:yes stop_codon:yes gene_type:complete